MTQRASAIYDREKVLTSDTSTSGRESFVEDPGRVAELASAIASGALSPVALVERYLDRIAKVDGDVQAWRLVDRDGALSMAKTREAEAKAGRLRGRLHGIPFGVKDIIDVEGMTTLCNSRSLANAAPATADADVVLALRAAGAIPLGKVHTTEFAFFDPSPARNPHNLNHTPGGSSSGSAAAVAAGTVPIAIGTQTVASVNRPAAYCGIAAFKPSTGSVPGYGISPLAPSFDTAGFYGYTVEDAVTVYEVLQPQFLKRDPAPAETAPISIILLEDAHFDDAIPEMREAHERLAKAAAAGGHDVARRKSPISFARLFELQRTAMLYETGRTLRSLLDKPSGTVGPRLLDAIEQGRSIPLDQYLAAREETARMRQTVLDAIGESAALSPAAPGAAPEGLGSTGDPRYISPWTAIGGPILTVPAGNTRSGLPIGCILASRPGSDGRLCRWARRLAPIFRAANG
jgi:aspartyl-tRNA(Asn)/glutamyl-tRNA(Gln) amidotransferase subunit A